MPVAGTVIHPVVHAGHRLAGHQVVVRAVNPAGALGQLAEQRHDLDQKGQAANSGAISQQGGGHRQRRYGPLEKSASEAAAQARRIPSSRVAASRSRSSVLQKAKRTRVAPSPGRLKKLEPGTGATPM